MGYLPYQLVCRIPEPSTESPFLGWFNIYDGIFKLFFLWLNDSFLNGWVNIHHMIFKETWDTK